MWNFGYLAYSSLILLDTSHSATYVVEVLLFVILQFLLWILCMDWNHRLSNQ